MTTRYNIYYEDGATETLESNTVVSFTVVMEEAWLVIRQQVTDPVSMRRSFTTRHVPAHRIKLIMSQD